MSFFEAFCRLARVFRVLLHSGELKASNMPDFRKNRALPIQECSTDGD